MDLSPLERARLQQFQAATERFRPLSERASLLTDASQTYADHPIRYGLSEGGKAAIGGGLGGSLLLSTAPIIQRIMDRKAQAKFGDEFYRNVGRALAIDDRLAVPFIKSNLKVLDSRPPEEGFDSLADRLKHFWSNEGINSDELEEAFDKRVRSNMTDLPDGTTFPKGVMREGLIEGREEAKKLKKNLAATFGEEVPERFAKIQRSRLKEIARNAAQNLVAIEQGGRAHRAFRFLRRRRWPILGATAAASGILGGAKALRHANETANKPLPEMMDSIQRADVDMALRSAKRSPSDLLFPLLYMAG